MAFDNQTNSKSATPKKRKRTIPLWLLLAIIALVSFLLGIFHPVRHSPM
jgi:hypothetical protein